MEEPALTLAVALALGMLGQVLARHARLPGIVLLLALGAAAGPDGLNWIHPDALGPALFAIVDFGVAVILFEGGLNLEASRLRRQERPIRWLITVGAAVTFVGGSLAAWLVLGWPWRLALLFGSLVIVTGPTVVTPLLRELRLKPRVKTILEAEGVLIDPIGAIASVVMLEVALVPQAATLAGGARYVAMTLVLGTVGGLAGGAIIGGALKSRRLVPEGLENVFTLASVLLLFHVCDHVVTHSGLLAVTIAGIIVGNLDTRVDRDLREFKDQLGVMLVGVLFILLAANTRLADVVGLGWRGLAVVGLLVVAVRPASAWLATSGSGLAANERHFVAWIAPRGIVAAAVASLSALSLQAAGVQGGKDLAALVFLTIAITVLMAGGTAGLAASRLGLRQPRRDRVTVVGVTGLGLALARALRDGGVSVVFIDTDPRRCHVAEQAGFSVIWGNALEERVMARARLDLSEYAIGATFNEHANSLFTSHARELFHVPVRLVALDEASASESPDHLRLQQAEVLFDGPHDGEWWDARFRRNDATVERFAYTPPGPPATPAAAADLPRPAGRPADRFVILTIERKGRVVPMRRSLVPETGDVASVAIDTARREEALTELGSLGWRPETAAA